MIEILTTIGVGIFGGITFSLSSWAKKKGQPFEISKFAQTVLLGITLFAAFIGWNYLFVFIISFRLTIYIYRKYATINKNFIISIIRITIPLAAILLFNNQNFLLITGLIAIGEIIDRLEFYNELNVPDPRNEYKSFYLI